jgi:hypothetical protein
MCIHIELTTLADGTYDLVPESESEQRKAQVNLTEVTEDLNQSLEEPPTSFAYEGKPCMLRALEPCMLRSRLFLHTISRVSLAEYWYTQHCLWHYFQECLL